MKTTHLPLIVAAALLCWTHSGAADGKATYDGACFACHGAGVAGAPKLDDRDAWAQRLAQAEETLIKHAIEGFQGKTGVMPAKGGFMHLSDEEVAAAVRYMISQVPQ